MIDGESNTISTSPASLIASNVVGHCNNNNKEGNQKDAEDADEKLKS